ncbi:hypothetical protein L210DRAFT_3387694 [Boletus edulis BED1]|uniref:MYND-type domain-containing protein n=1 Tax=Boletus edulis BED1 TaxID=1328754 RepID=A0AAD4C4J3_BOLED|nr:hypothetical protein L210DRAFT_3387694 [Boletus edulis BED1]
MQALNPEEVQDILNVTAQSITRHCGLTNDPSNPDVRSEEHRLIDLSRQVGLFSRQQITTPLNILIRFSAKHLPALVAQYKKHTAPYNIATVMINAVCHLPYFVRYQKTPAASDLAVLQATRIANTMDDPSEPKIIFEICQFLSTFLVLQGTTAIPEDVKQKLIPKLNTWRRRYQGQFPGETSDRCYLSLTGSLEMVVLSKMMKETLEKPLNQCGVRGCDRRVDSVGPELQQCSRQCGASHQKQHWTEHKKSCYPATF